MRRGERGPLPLKKERQNPHRRHTASVPATHAGNARARHAVERSHPMLRFLSRRPHLLPSAWRSVSALPPTARPPSAATASPNIERLYLFRDLISEAWDKISAHDMLDMAAGID